MAAHVSPVLGHISSRLFSSSFTVIGLLLLPVPLVVLRYFDIINENDGHELMTTIIIMMLFCYLTTAFAYFRVYQAICRDQQRVQASEPAQNIGHPSIDLANYKNQRPQFYAFVCYFLCVSYLMLFLPASILQEAKVQQYSNLALLLLFLSSSLNPGLYLWRMKDIRNGVKHLLCKSSWRISGRTLCFVHVGVLTGTGL